MIGKVNNQHDARYVAQGRRSSQGSAAKLSQDLRLLVGEAATGHCDGGLGLGGVDTKVGFKIQDRRRSLPNAAQCYVAMNGVKRGSGAALKTINTHRRSPVIGAAGGSS